LNTTLNQQGQHASHQEVLQFTDPLYYRYEKSEIGVTSQLALEAGNWTFKAELEKEGLPQS